MKKINVEGKSTELISILDTQFKGKVNFLIIVSYDKLDRAFLNYKDRCQIETCFKAMKTSGGDIEKAHLKDIQWVENLVLFIMIAFVWYCKIGIYLHRKLSL